jgi:hypothetical protein
MRRDSIDTGESFLARLIFTQTSAVKECFGVILMFWAPDPKIMVLLSASIPDL